MGWLIEEMFIIRGRRTSIRRRRFDSVYSCAICESDTELISVAAGSRLIRTDILELCKWCGRLTGTTGTDFQPQTLVCLKCLSKYRADRPGTAV